MRIQLARRSGWAVATITDEGPGLPPGSGELIFSRCCRYRPDRDKRDDRHTGLGRALVRAIVEGCGGSVHAATRPEGGAGFAVRLPVA